MTSHPPSGKAKTANTRGQELARTLLPPLLALILALPCFRFTFIYDDFNFLHRVWPFDLKLLLPDPAVAFYRPLSREIYFALLSALDRTNALWGHIGNAAFVAASVAILADVTRVLVGRRAGFVAGVLYASLSPLPFLVGFISCSQDIFAGLFLLIALRLELAGRSWPAVIACAAALLSKETAAVVIPIVAALPWLLRRDRLDLRRNVLRYGGLALAWCAMSPKVQSLLRGSVVTGEGGYVGLDNPNVWVNTANLLAALVNLPPMGASTKWATELNEVLVIGMALIVAAYWVLPNAGRGDAIPQFPRERTLAVGLLLVTLPGTFTVAFVKHWAHYFTCIPAIGASILFSMVLAKLDRRAIIGILAVFLVVGVWSRGMGGVRRFWISEENFRSTSNDLRRIAEGMKRLRPAFAESTRIYVTVQARDQRVEGHFRSFQAPRVWYNDATITVHPLEEFDPTFQPSVLFWIDRSANVFELDYPSLEPRTAGLPIQYGDYQKARRSLAFGLARAGRVDEAVQAVLRMRATHPVQWAFDRRLAATLYIEAGRRDDAARLIEKLPPMDRTEALYALVAALGTYEPSERFDLAAFEAFGVQANDVEAWRYLMRSYVLADQYDAAHRMALHLRSVSPSDEDAGLVIKAMLEKPQWEPVVQKVTR